MATQVEEVRFYSGNVFSQSKRKDTLVLVFETTTENMNSGKINDVKSGYLLLGEAIHESKIEKALIPNKFGYVIITEDGSKYHRDILSYDHNSKSGLFKCRNSNAEAKELFLNLDSEGTSIFEIVVIQG